MNDDDSPPLIRDIAPFGVRMPPDLKDRVQAAAKAANRSMNAEIVAALEEKYPPSSMSFLILQNLIVEIQKSVSLADKVRHIKAANERLAQFGITINTGEDGFLTLSLGRDLGNLKSPSLFRQT